MDEKVEKKEVPTSFKVQISLLKVISILGNHFKSEKQKECLKQEDDQHSETDEESTSDSSSSSSSSSDESSCSECDCSDGSSDSTTSESSSECSSLLSLDELPVARDSIYFKLGSEEHSEYFREIEKNRSQFVPMNLSEDDEEICAITGGVDLQRSRHAMGRSCITQEKVEEIVPVVASQSSSGIRFKKSTNNGDQIADTLATRLRPRRKQIQNRNMRNLSGGNNEKLQPYKRIRPDRACKPKCLNETFLERKAKKAHSGGRK